METGMPSNLCFQMDLSNPAKFDKMMNMNRSRYGHSSVFLRGVVYVIGGYAHPDT